MLGIKKQTKHFNFKKFQYDLDLILSPPMHTKEEIRTLLKILKQKNIRKVGDFGSGTGRLTIPLAKEGYLVTAIDPSVKSLERLKRLALRTNIKINYQNCLSKSANFDAIAGCDVLHHVNMKKELARIYSSIKEGGRIVFSEPNAFNPSWYLYFFLKGIWKYESGLLNCTYFNIKNILIRTGFREVKIIGLGLLPRILFTKTFICLVNDRAGNIPIVKVFSYRFIIVAEK